MPIYKIAMPLRIVWGKGKTTKFTFNLNPYRNAHHHTLNRAKAEYAKLAIDTINRANIPKLKEISILFRYFPGTSIRTDLGNVCSIHEKFFLDALVEAGIIEDDNYHIVKKVIYTFGAIDRSCPRMEIFIKDESVKLEKPIMPEKNILKVENVTHIEVEGNKTIIFVEKGTSVTIEFTANASEPLTSTEEAVTAPAEKKAPAKKQATKKKEEPVEAEPVKEGPKVFETDEGFVEFENDEITGINDVFEAVSDNANKGDEKPVVDQKKSVFGNASEKQEKVDDDNDFDF